MKRKLAFVFLSLMLAAGVAGLAACGDEKGKYSLTAPDDVTVEIGTVYDIPDVKVEGAENVFASYEVKDKDGKVVEAPDRRLSVNAFGPYTVRYYYQPKGRTLAQDTQTVSVSDSVLPYIQLVSYRAFAVMGEDYVLPEVQVADSLGEDIQPVITVTAGDETFTPEGETYRVTSYEDFTVKITATNSRGKSSEKTIEVYVRRDGELESADREGLLSAWTPLLYSSFTFNDDPAYIKSGEGSFRFVRTQHDIGAGRPKIRYSAPALDDWSALTQVSFWVYNNGKNKITIETLDGGGDSCTMMKDVYPGMWTKVTVTKAQLEGYADWTGARYDITDMEEIPFTVCFYNAAGADYDVYLDEFTFAAAERPQASYAKDRVVYTASGAYTPLAPEFTGTSDSVTYRVFEKATEKKVDTAENGVFTPESGKTYDIIATVTDTAGAEYQARYTLVSVTKFSPDALIYNEIKPSAYFNNSGMSAAASAEGIRVYSYGWGREGQGFAFYASDGAINITDTSAYAALQLTLTNGSADTDLKFRIGQGSANTPYAFTVPADGAAHTYVIPLADFNLAGAIEAVTMVFDSDRDQGIFVGDVLISDMTLIAAPEVTFGAGETLTTVGETYSFPTVAGADSAAIAVIKGADSAIVSGNTHMFTETGLYTVYMTAENSGKTFVKSYTLTVGEEVPDNALISNYTRPNQYSNPGVMTSALENDAIRVDIASHFPKDHAMFVFNGVGSSYGNVLNVTDTSGYATLQLTFKNATNVALKINIGCGSPLKYAFRVPADNAWHTYAVDLAAFGLQHAALPYVYFQTESDSSEFVLQTPGSIYLKDILLLTSAETAVTFGSAVDTATVGENYSFPAVTGADDVNITVWNGTEGADIAGVSHTFDTAGSYTVYMEGVKNGVAYTKIYSLTVRAAMPDNALVSNYVLPAVANPWCILGNGMSLDGGAIKLQSYEYNPGSAAQPEVQTVMYQPANWLVNDLTGYVSLRVSVRTTAPLKLYMGGGNLSEGAGELPLAAVVTQTNEWQTVIVNLEKAKVAAGQNFYIRLCGVDTVKLAGDVWLKDFLLLKADETAVTFGNAADTATVGENYSFPAVTGTEDVNITVWNGTEGADIAGVSHIFDAAGSYTVYMEGVKDGVTYTASYKLLVQAAAPYDSLVDNYTLPQVSNQWSILGSGMSLDEGAIKLQSYEYNPGSAAQPEVQTVMYQPANWLVNDLTGYVSLRVTVRTTAPLKLYMGGGNLVGGAGELPLAAVVTQTNEWQTIAINLQESQVKNGQNFYIRLCGADTVKFAGDVWLKDFYLLTEQDTEVSFDYSERVGANEVYTLPTATGADADEVKVTLYDTWTGTPLSGATHTFTASGVYSVFAEAKKGDVTYTRFYSVIVTLPLVGNAAFDNYVLPAAHYDQTWGIVGASLDDDAIKLTSKGNDQPINQTIWFSGDQWLIKDGTGFTSITVKVKASAEVKFSVSGARETGFVLAGTVPADGEYHQLTVSLADAGAAPGNNFFVQLSGTEGNAFVGEVWMKDFALVA